MTTTTEKTQFTIDATNMRLGDVATQAARMLMGKHSTDFARHIAAPVEVTINNVSKMDIPLKKREEIYQRYSGYPGGRKVETLEHLANRLGYSEVVRRTIAGMLPTNRLKKPRLKNLIITE